MSQRAVAALAAAVSMGLVVFTGTYLTEPWEGKRNLAYYDYLGRTWTYGFGETRGVKKGDYCSDAECSRMLYERLEKDYHQPLQRCVDNFDTLPIGLQASMLDAAYNVGVGAICKSTAARRARAKDYRGACNALTWFNKAGGRVVRGLKLRREYGDTYRIGELEICLTSVEQESKR
ncbi:Lysozyme RrrD [Methyloligella halotolerans]|uniref:Lysozyme n=1 Tax=Methyloligella halotolerans TaxID=1177755 RepID=A0A1E2RZP8_9HYPH|nr:lysozyme [Methyloligella halotolerans]ODA67691.1 Lysozyme RrrD [Methyloligella halotolerans]